MMPRMRQRVVIVVAMVAGAMAWSWVAGLLAAPDGSSGISLMSARVGVAGAVAVLGCAGVVAMMLGVVASATGNALSGVFAVSGSLGVLAALGGPIDGWMLRSRLPGDYLYLMFEVLLWQAGWVAMVLLIQFNRSSVRTRWPALAFEDHLGVDLHVRFPRVQSLAAGVVCGACAGVVGYFLIRSSDSGQVIGSLLAAFTAGGLVAGLVFPQVNPAGVLFGPAWVALGSYLCVWVGYSGEQAVLEAWFAGGLPGVALALPIHYASAGVAGCAMGVGLAQGIEAAKVQVVEG